MEPFSNSTDLLLIFFLFAGLIGTFIPILPGPTLILMGAALHSLLNDFAPINGLALTLLTCFCFIAAIGQTMFTSIGTHKFGGSKYGMIGGSIGLIAGLFIPIPGGILIGAFSGALLAELYVAKKEFKLASKAGFGGVLGLLVAFLFEILITFGMTIYIITLFY